MEMMKRVSGGLGDFHGVGVFHAVAWRDPRQGAQTARRELHAKAIFFLSLVTALLVCALGHAPS